MSDVQGIIFADNKNVNMNELTLCRSLAALPVAGRYRLIDFALSNMVNSDIFNVGVVTRYNYQSLMDHIATGKPWDLNRKQNGLFIFPPYISGGCYTNSHSKIDALNDIRGYLNKSRQKYVLLAEGNVVCNINLKDVYEFHIANNADITVVCSNDCDEDIKTDGEKIVDIGCRPKSLMGIYLMEKSLLIKKLDKCIAYGEHDFLTDIIAKSIKKLNVLAYKFDGYLKIINDKKSYFEFNMEMLNHENRLELFDDNNKIYTKIKDEPPAKYGKDSIVKNCLVADGCLVEGYVENCVLFRGVKIKKDAIVKNSIILQGSEVNEGSMLDNVILDKEVIINCNKTLVGEGGFPIIIGKKAVV